MNSIHPLSGHLISSKWAAEVVAPAFDSLTVTQRKEFRLQNPNTYMHVTRSASDEPDGDVVDERTLTMRGRDSLNRLRSLGAFERLEKPAFFAYRLGGEGAPVALIAEYPADLFARNTIPHEEVQPERVSLLADHMKIVGAVSSPIALASGTDGLLAPGLETVQNYEPLLDFETVDGERQTIWQLPEDLGAAMAEVLIDEPLFIIDGHHRASANRMLLDAGIGLPVLVAVFPKRALNLRSFHRMVRLPPKLSETDFLAGIKRRFRVEEISELKPPEHSTIAIYLDGSWHRVLFDEPPITGSAIVKRGSLDAVVLEREILRPLARNRFGTVDVTYASAGRGFHGLRELAHKAGRVPIAVPPATIEEMMEVAEGGLTMPAKSTFFTPKVRGGIFLRVYRD